MFSSKLLANYVLDEDMDNKSRNKILSIVGRNIT